MNADQKEQTKRIGWYAKSLVETFTQGSENKQQLYELSAALVIGGARILSVQRGPATAAKHLYRMADKYAGRSIGVESPAPAPRANVWKRRIARYIYLMFSGFFWGMCFGVAFAVFADLIPWLSGAS
ncbi:MAG: hypothetical protein C0605_07800 [Hyphomicrobiales bacterium]|nr:MAG: hypothetical protein C0605_07800 [Hyphomicrobiales bacterium]